MAKKAGRTVSEPTGATSVPSRDALQRLSYLYQASVLLDNIGLAAPSSNADADSRRARNPPRALKPVSRHLVRTMSEVAMKATVRMDPAVKRTVCKQCDSVLVPGISSSVRIKPSGPHAHLVVYTCSTCLAQRRFPAPPHLTAEPETDPTSTSTDSNPVPSLPSSSAAATSRPMMKRTKRERREARQARQPVLFERKGHVVVRGTTVVHRDE